MSALRLALFPAAVIAAFLDSLPLIGLIGAVAVLTTAHSRAKRRQAKAGVWAASTGLAWVVLMGVLHAGPHWALVGPVVAGVVAIVLNRPRRRRAPRSPSAILRKPAEKWPSG